MRMFKVVFVAAFLSAAWIAAAGAAEDKKADDTYTKEEILAKATGFFGAVTKGLAKAIEKVFHDQGRPNGFIPGEEASGAIGIGLRYGKGELHRKTAKTIPVFWQGPSIGFDFGGNASKVFVLVYKLKRTEDMFRRYPGVEGSLYFIAGFGVNYQQAGDTILAPIRTGVGFRAGANIGYLHYTRKHSWVPF
ncbi:MAG: DUF1134 domain-containing protein [Alphaproteobacteria bacterium]